MQKHPLGLLLAAAMLAGSNLSSAATIVSNNTGLLTSTFSFLDYENTAGTTATSGVGTMTNNLTGAGTDGDANAFGTIAAYSSGGNVTYSFTELVAGQTYNIYACWYGNGAANCAIDVTANSVNLGTFSQTLVSAAGATGFTAHEEVTDPLSSEARGFALLGTGIADANGDLIIVSTKSTTTTFGRYDAFAVAPVPVPEPSIALLGSLSLLGMLRRRRQAD